MSKLFMSTWEKEAMSHKSSHSWVSDVLRSEYGKNYLETIQTWFNKYPKASEHLKNLLESFVTEDHLGGANELFWWELMKKFQWKAHSIPENSERRPDFHITVPLEFFCEVTTVNISNKDRVALRSESGAELNYEATIFRVLRKATEEKKAQIDYSFKQGYPGILVLFDYTTWSGLATNFLLSFKQNLYKGSRFDELPKTLSAIIYIEKKFICMKFCFSIKRSAGFHNPYAKYKLTKTVFKMFNQYDEEGKKTPFANSTKQWNDWFCL